MSIRSTSLVALVSIVATVLSAGVASADGGNSATATSSAGASTTSAAPEPATSEPATPPTSSAKEPWPNAGQKEYKQRINVVARKPLNHDIQYIDARDRGTWNGYTTWQGVRDERPMIARKTMGFHDPRPHRTRQERVLILSRGPIKGPAFNE